MWSEYIIDKSKLTRKPIKKKNFHNKQWLVSSSEQIRSSYQQGDSILQLGDKMIILALTQAIGRVEDMFM